MVLCLIILLHAQLVQVLITLSQGRSKSLTNLDAIGVTAQPIPNSSQGTVPGDVILLSWRGVTLQLPRTNNAGAPSYTDGRWWWQVEDPDHPDFRQRRGTIVSYDCTPEQ